MDLIEIIKKRRSVRKYKPDPIPAESIQHVLEAARQAPSWGNLQCWKFIVVKDQETRTRLAEACQRRMWMAQAPIIVVGCADPSQSGKKGKGQEYYLVDLGVGMEHLILAATEIGLGSCWIALFDEDSVKHILGIPSNIRVVAMTPLGLADEEYTQGQRKDLSQIYSENRWK